MMDIFLTTCDHEAMAPDRYNWDFVLVKLMVRLQEAAAEEGSSATKLDANTIRFCKMNCLLLSGKTTDFVCTNAIVKLYRKGYMDIQKMANADLRELKNIIYHTGFHRKRPVFMKKMAQMIMEKWNGILPSEVEDLTSFSGVGRKTAILTANEAFGLFAGMGCDIHVVKMLLALLMVNTGKRKLTPLLAEESLMTWVPEIRWPLINKLFGSMGQLFTQMLSLGKSSPPEKLVGGIVLAAGKFMHQEHHIKLLWCMIASVRRQYKWGRLKEKQSPSSRIQYRGTAEGDTEPDDDSDSDEEAAN